MSIGEALLLLATWVVVGFAPGLVVATALRPGVGWVRSVALAPLLSFALVMVVAIVLTVVAADINAGTVLVPTFILVVVCAVLGRQWSGTGEPLRVTRTHGAALGAIAIVGVVLWWWASSGLQLVPPNDDGSNHGLFTTQIRLLHTVIPDQVVVGDVLSGQPSSPYYPLAMHLVAALMAAVSGLPVATALTVQVALCAGVFLPLGMYVLTRRLVPARPVVAVTAAVFSIMVAAMPYYITSWGGYPFIIGMALLPVAIDALAGVGRDSHPLGGVVIVGGVLIALFAVHSSEMVVALGLAAILVIAASLRGECRARDSAIAWIGGIAALVLFIVPQFGAVRAGAGNVAVAALMQPESFAGSLINAFTYVWGVPNPALTPDVPIILRALYAIGGVLVWVFVLTGCVVSVRRRWAPEWVLAFALLVMVTVLSSMRISLIDVLTIPWYSRWDRLVMNEVVLMAPLAALGAVVTIDHINARRRTAGVMLVVAVVALPQLAIAALVARGAYTNNSLAGSGARAAYAWLQQRVQPGERVLNDPTDGSGWMWALEQVPPLFAVAPHQIDGWGDRLLLQRRAADVGSDPAIAAVADQWQVRYAYVGPRTYLEQQAKLSVSELVAGGGWTVAFERDGATVLERVR